MLVLSTVGCTTFGHRKNSWRWPIASTVADSISSEQIAAGVRLHHLVRNATPLRVYVLDVDLNACISPRALKGAETAVGRTTTSDLMRAMPVTDAPIAAVNADFFIFAPPGVPTNALIIDGTVFSGPSDRPVLSFDQRGKPSIGVLKVAGTITTARGAVPFTTWNRPSANAVGIVDARWGSPLDSLSRPGAMQLIPVSKPGGTNRYRIASLPSAHNGLARGDTMILVGSARASLVAGDTVQIAVTMTPAMPFNAVGAYPVLVRDSAVVTTLDAAGAESFRGVNPRTVAGFADNGRRLLLVVIDGRQAGYSAGTTTRETALLMQALGAREAVNLDGGGSTVMVVRDAITGVQRVVNKPSDAVGERPVGDALAITGRCHH